MRRAQNLIACLADRVGDRAASLNAALPALTAPCKFEPDPTRARSRYPPVAPKGSAKSGPRFARPGGSRARARRQRGGRCHGPRVVDEFDDGPPLHHSGERPGVPVGQAHAPMRIGAADLERLGRTMDAIAPFVEVHPHRADRIVGAGRDPEFPMGAYAWELKLGIIVVDG